MLKTAICSLGSLFVILLLSATLAYSIPSTINYQGVLTDSVGVPLNQDVSITFRLYDAATAGTEAWSETQTVTVTNGVYSVQLGQSTSFDGIDFSVDYWLEVEVGGEKFSPRQALTSVPYAMQAKNSSTLDEMTPAELLSWNNLADIPLSFSSFATSGNFGIGTDNPTVPLYIQQTVGGLTYPLKVENHSSGSSVGTSDVGILFSTGGSGNEDRGKGALVYETTGTWNRGSFHFLQDTDANSNNPNMADSVMTITNSGRVGIGTTDPTELLELSGNLKLTQPENGIIFEDGSKQVTAFRGAGPGSQLDADTVDGLHAADIVAFSGGAIPTGSKFHIDQLEISGLQVNDPGGYTLDGTTVKRSVEVIEYLDGGGSIQHKRPGTVAVSDIVISHTIPIGSQSSLSQWFQQVKAGTVDRKMASMIFFRSGTTNEFVRLNCFSLFPRAISYRIISDSEVEEIVVLSAEEFEILSSSSAEVNSNWKAEVESVGDLHARRLQVGGGRVSVVEYTDGSDSTVHKRPGPYGVGDLELFGLGAGSSMKFVNWFWDISTTVSRHSLVMLGGTTQMFNEYACWPSSMAGLSLDSEGDFVINKATITCEDIEKL